MRRRVFGELSGHKFLDPCRWIGCPRLLRDVALELDDAGIGAVVGISNEKGGRVAKPAFGQQPEIREREMLVNDTVQVWIEMKGTRIGTFIVGTKSESDGRTG